MSRAEFRADTDLVVKVSLVPSGPDSGWTVEVTQGWT
ncbi:hypothetical protein QFZ56_007566 [Streptomyces achromogenes]|uniref:Uncharacterized protein n=1 Tax=Streptomyces achromogenes TaxID=67255 RepID=A0ABU0QFV2_STRAH|nr:hypothetical protein [Streptomyces achromogenes]